jgi:TM2 domain-containing membrane protein YozV
MIQEGITIHDTCIQDFEKEPEKYGGKAIEKTEVQTEVQTEAWEDLVPVPSNSEPSDKDFVITLLICVFLGGLGVHRFFVDKIGTGVLMLVTLGGLGIWWIIDIILIVTSSFEDSEGRVIVYQAAGATNTTPGTHVSEKVVEAPPAKDIPAEIEKLADLKDKGIITDEEFQQKKQELLERI